MSHRRSLLACRLCDGPASITSRSASLTPDAGLAFYRDVIGLTEVARPDLGRGSWLDAGGQQVQRNRPAVVGDAAGDSLATAARLTRYDATLERPEWWLLRLRMPQRKLSAELQGGCTSGMTTGWVPARWSPIHRVRRVVSRLPRAGRHPSGALVLLLGLPSDPFYGQTMRRTRNVPSR